MNIDLKMINNFVIVLLVSLALRAAITDAQADQSGFISIDCGLPENSDYVDSETGVRYTSDSGFIDSGVSKSISPALKTKFLEQQFLNVRSFPQGQRNCYTLRPAQGKDGKYLIRARFMYGNFDGASQTPKFDLHLGIEHWDTIDTREASSPYIAEIIHTPSSDYINVCLVKTGPGTPYISTLELRALNKTMYPTPRGSLLLYDRVNFNSLTNQSIRYKDDIYDRKWWPFQLPKSTTLSTTSIIDTSNLYNLPQVCMISAATPTNSSGLLSISWTANVTDKFYIYLHFAEFLELKLNQSRKFNIYVNDKLNKKDYTPVYLSASSLYSEEPETGKTEHKLVINKSIDSTLPPIINAAEIYTLKEFSLPQTYDEDVVAVLSIMSTYELIKNWQGDPCAPEDYVWDGVTCIKDGFDPPRIISLNLSSNGLDGTIATSISNLTMLQNLDLSNNNLIGVVPIFLAQMASLKVLKLEGNNFTMPFPPQLLEKFHEGNLQFSFDDPNINNDNNNNKPKDDNKNNVIIPIVASVGAVLFLLFAVSLIAFCVSRMRKQKAITKVEPRSNKNDGIVESREMPYSAKNYAVETESPNNRDYILVESKSRKFTYNEVLTMTNNFQRVIGRGGFGTVYHGFVGDSNTQVAVKMLSHTSTQGYKEFQSEANLLLTIHHKNLTSLIGYCHEGTNMGIIYEYMANGNVERHLLGTGPYVLTWEERLRIAIDAGQGLEYLHHGCIPPIIHRDIKNTNILLDEKFRAKLADFGLSRAFPIDDATHVSTVVAGTPGYLDPEYYSTTRLTEKSDIYSFGVILMEAVTGRSALPRNNDEVHIIAWINSELEKGDIENIVDPRLRKDYAISSIWKFVELAMACVARSSARRPTMTFVVAELNACLAIEMSRSEIGSKDSVGLIIPMSIESTLGPRAR